MLTERNIYPAIEKVLPSPEAIIVTGMRRVGKTTLLKTIYDHIASPNKIFLDLENPRNQLYFEKTDYDAIYANLQLLGLKQNERAYVFLDEIQRIKTFPSIIKYLLDTYGVKFILSGSSSYYMKNQFSESLAGRSMFSNYIRSRSRSFCASKVCPLHPLSVHPLQCMKHTKPAWMNIYNLAVFLA